MPSPETPSRPICGFTTQKAESWRSNFSMPELRRACTITLLRSSLSVTVSTTPTSTLRLLILVLPASSPSAVVVTSVTTGP